MAGGGSIPLAASTPDKVLNSCLVFDDLGEQVARYTRSTCSIYLWQ